MPAKKICREREQMFINNYLSLNRTELSVERTFLSFIRTALTFIAAGLSFIQFFDLPLNKIIGLLLIAAGICFFFYGLFRFRKMRAVIKSSRLKLKSIKRLDEVV